MENTRGQCFSSVLVSADALAQAEAGFVYIENSGPQTVAFLTTLFRLAPAARGWECGDFGFVISAITREGVGAVAPNTLGAVVAGGRLVVDAQGDDNAGEYGITVEAFLTTGTDGVALGEETLPLTIACLSSAVTTVGRDGRTFLTTHAGTQGSAPQTWQLVVDPADVTGSCGAEPILGLRLFGAYDPAGEAIGDVSAAVQGGPSGNVVDGARANTPVTYVEGIVTFEPTVSDSAGVYSYELVYYYDASDPSKTWTWPHMVNFRVRAATDEQAESEAAFQSAKALLGSQLPMIEFAVVGREKIIQLDLTTEAGTRGYSLSADLRRAENFVVYEASSEVSGKLVISAESEA